MKYQAVQTNKREFSEDHKSFIEAKITKMVSVTQEDNLAPRWFQRSCSMAVCSSEHSLCSAVMGIGILLGSITWPTYCPVSIQPFIISQASTSSPLCLLALLQVGHLTCPSLPFHLESRVLVHPILISAAWVCTVFFWVLRSWRERSIFKIAIFGDHRFEYIGKAKGAGPKVWS